MFAFYLIYLYCDDHTKNSAAEQEQRKERWEEEKLMKSYSPCGKPHRMEYS